MGLNCSYVFLILVEAQSFSILKINVVLNLQVVWGSIVLSCSYFRKKIWGSCSYNIVLIKTRVYKKMRPIWLWSTAKPIFQQITNLTFDPMTLTLNKFVAFINVNPHTKFGFNPTNSTWVITRNARRLLTGEFDLDT